MIASNMAVLLCREFSVNPKYFHPEYYEGSDGSVTLKWLRYSRILKISIQEGGTYALIQKVGPGLNDIVPKLFLNAAGFAEIRKAWAWFNSN